MNRTSIDGVASDVEGAAGRRDLSGLLGTTDVAVNYYRLAPGEGLPGGLHAHADQEEVFVVLEGEVTFETLAARSGPTSGADEIRVEAGEAVRFAPGEFHSGRNDADGELSVLALGAPRDSEDVRVPLECPECGRGDVRLRADERGVEFVCPDCGDERVPRACPDCGGEMRVVLGEETRTVVRCSNCDAEFAEPPLRE